MHCRKLILGGLLAASVAVASAAPAFATQTRVIQPTATQIRTVDGESHILVDGNGTVPGTPVKGRQVEARVYVPANVRFTHPVRVFLADYQTTSFDLSKSDQRLLQSISAPLVPGKWTVLRLELRCKMRAARCYHPGKLYKHQLDMGVGTPIGQQWKWLGGFPKYTGKQLLASSFVKARCKPVHHRPRKPKGCHCNR